MQAFRQAQEEAAAGKSRKTTAAADAAEVARVLAARSDYECLQVWMGDGHYTLCALVRVGIPLH